MMNYELAKELRAKGFKQRGWGFRACEHNSGAIKEVVQCDCGIEDITSVPGLKELIMDCIPHCRSFSLTYENGMWNAEDEYDTSIHSEGKEPEETVARLWLKLKQEKNI